MRAVYWFPIVAEEAYRIGLAQWLTPADGPMDKAMEVADHIASLATRVTKESRRSGLDSPLPEAALEMTEDKAESHQSWRERREPTFKGR